MGLDAQTLAAKGHPALLAHRNGVEPQSQGPAPLRQRPAELPLIRAERGGVGHPACPRPARQEAEEIVRHTVDVRRPPHLVAPHHIGVVSPDLIIGQQGSTVMERRRLRLDIGPGKTAHMFKNQLFLAAADPLHPRPPRGGLDGIGRLTAQPASQTVARVGLFAANDPSLVAEPEQRLLQGPALQEAAIIGPQGLCEDTDFHDSQFVCPQGARHSPARQAKAGGVLFPTDLAEPYPASAGQRYTKRAERTEG